MKNSNTLGKSSFIEYTILLSISISILYRFNCFTGIYGITVFQSKLVFWALTILLIALGVYITYAKRRNYLSILVNIVLPFEIYIIASTYRYISIIYIIALSVIAFLSILYFILIVFQKIKHKKHVKKIVCNRIKFASLGIRTIIVVLLIFITLPICVKSAFGYELIRSNVDASIETSSSDEWLLNNNIETVAKLHEDTWSNLSIFDKLDVLGTIKNVEMHYFGINHEVYLDAGNLDGNIRGCYNPKEHKITIDIEHLKSSDSKEVLKTLLHECRHIYDRMCVDLYNQIDDGYKNMLMFCKVADFKEDFSNYTSGAEKPLEYYFQPVEISARQYSETAVIEYFKYIDKYLQKNNNTKTEE